MSLVLSQQQWRPKDVTPYKRQGIEGNHTMVAERANTEAGAEKKANRHGNLCNKNMQESCTGFQNIMLTNGFCAATI